MTRYKVVSFGIFVTFIYLRIKIGRNMDMLKKSFFVTIIILTIVILSNHSIAQNKTEPLVKQIAGLNAKFVFALISDGNGGAWV
ncbi:MAG: hypothetical protein LBC74_09550, partial [Planctomycetaceae bacterium]|nr:hypothetical protein [Planctomycetaceae bacterium]